MKVLNRVTLLAVAALSAASAQNVCAQPRPAASNRFLVPDAVSPAARTALEQLYGALAKAPPLKHPAKLAEYDALNIQAQAVSKPMSDQGVQAMKATVVSDRIAGVPVVRIRPASMNPKLAPLVFVHGGGFIVGSASSTAILPALIGTAMHREIISIDYTLAPRADFNRTTDEVAAVWKALLAKGIPAGAMAIFGDSAGGNLTLTATLKIRDQGMPLPGALYVLSPAVDLTWSGDTFTTLRNADPILDPRAMAWVTEAYVGKGNPRHPYASPIYGDYTKAFPPTLIQGGTREFLLSDFVRGYQALRAGGHEAVLDLYEGMPHVFQSLLWNTPEGRTSIERAKAFLEGHLAPR